MTNPIRKILAQRRDRRRAARLTGLKPVEVFRDIYQNNTWGDEQSASGKGSNLEQTETIREVLPALLAQFEIRSILDLPCGDYYWMNHTDLCGVDYIGGDIVPDLIEQNRKTYQQPGVQFEILNVIEDTLPSVDLLFCRDCLVHLSEQNVFAAIENIKRSGITWLLTTTFPDTTENKDILTGQWRRINLETVPYSFPAPATKLLEDFPGDGDFADKSLALWRVSDLP